MNENSRNGESFLTGLVLGIILGAGFVYFLSSTEEGKVIKKRLKEKTENALDNLGELIEEIEEKGEEFKKKATEIQKQLEEKTSEVNFSSIEKLRERGRRAVKFFTRNGKPLI
jgi:gas vesicle protein